MKRIVFVLLLLHGVCGLGPALHAQGPGESPDPAEAYGTYPVYRQVVSEMFAQMGETRYLDHQEWTLDKHPSGWVLRWHGTTTPKPKVKRILFWDRTAAQYVPDLVLPAKDLPDQKPDPAFREANYRQWANGTGILYDVALFYGYPGAQRASIVALEGIGELPSGLAVSLARAYTEEALRLVNPEAVYPDQHHAFDSLFDKSLFHPDTLSLGERYFWRAAETYEQVSRLAPDFNTLEGTPALDWAAVLTTAWLQFSMIDDAKRASQFLEQTFYNEFLRATGRNLLASCPENTVLMTNGSQDYYLALAAQRESAYRDDVSLVCVTLLGQARYRHALVKGWLGKPLRGLVVGKGVAVMNLHDYFPDTTAAALLADWAAGKLDAGQGLVGFAGRRDTLHLNQDLLYAATLGEIAVLHAAAATRPIAYAVTVPPDRFFGNVRRSSVLQGMVRLLDWQVDSAKSANALREVAKDFTDRYRYPGIDKALAGDPGAMLWVRNYRGLAVEAAYGLAASDDVEGGLRLLNVVWRHMPEWVLPMEAFDVYSVKYYYQHGSAERGAEMSKSLYTTLLEQASNLSIAGLLDQLEALAEQHSQMDLWRTFRVQRGQTNR